MVQAKKQGEYHWDKGDVSWSPAPPPKKKKKKTESLIERLQRQKREKEKLIEMM